MRDLEQRTGVGRETIRYYIRLGLLPEPDRPKPNVAVYADEHVRRLTTIKRLQRERYLPLSFIKTLLDRPSHGEPATIPGLEMLLLQRVGLSGEEGDVTLAEAAVRYGVPLEDLQVLRRDGLIDGDGSGAQATLRPLDAAIVELWGRLRAAGYTPELGFFPDDLKIYADAVKPVADKEIERFFTRVPGALSAEPAAALGQAGIELVNDLLALLRTRLLLERIRALGAAD
jgi:DNA-binding transcriptional MerR regulator